MQSMRVGLARLLRITLKLGLKGVKWDLVLTLHWVPKTWLTSWEKIHHLRQARVLFLDTRWREPMLG